MSNILQISFFAAITFILSLLFLLSDVPRDLLTAQGDASTEEVSGGVNGTMDGVTTDGKTGESKARGTDDWSICNCFFWRLRMM